MFSRLPRCSLRQKRFYSNGKRYKTKNCSQAQFSLVQVCESLVSLPLSQVMMRNSREAKVLADVKIHAKMLRSAYMLLQSLLFQTFVPTTFLNSNQHLYQSTRSTAPFYLLIDQTLRKHNECLNDIFAECNSILFKLDDLKDTVLHYAEANESFASLSKPHSQGLYDTMSKLSKIEFIIASRIDLIINGFKESSSKFINMNSWQKILSSTAAHPTGSLPTTTTNNNNNNRILSDRNNTNNQHTVSSPLSAEDTQLDCEVQSPPHSPLLNSNHNTDNSTSTNNTHEKQDNDSNDMLGDRKTLNYARTVNKLESKINTDTTMTISSSEEEDGGIKSNKSSTNFDEMRKKKRPRHEYLDVEEVSTTVYHDQTETGNNLPEKRATKRPRLT